jgi:hypothetical protein
MTSDSQPDDLFLGLVASLQASAWVMLGKVIHPATGKVERHLEQAKETIDLLAVLETKTRGNLHPEEQRLLSQALFELRMNYVEELERPAATESTPPPPAPS